MTMKNLGLHREPAGPADSNRPRRAAIALVGFGAIAVAGALTDGTLAALLIAGGLLAHAGWDIIHLVRDIMVGRRYAEFCAALDGGLALTIVWGLF